MPKVIQNTNSREAKKWTSRSRINLVLHRGRKTYSSDPYSLRRCLHLRYISLLIQTLGTSVFKPRCSSTFNHHVDRQKFFRLSGIVASLLLLVLAVFSISPIVIKEDIAEGAAGDSTTTLTITSGKGTSSLALDVTSATGTFATSSDSDMAAFTVATNNYTGYTLNITGADDNGLLTNTDTASSITSLASATDATTFENGSADTYNNKWGYQLNLLDTDTSKYTALNDGNFLPSPTTSSTSLNTTECANGTTNCPDTVDTYGIKLGARIDYTKPAGSYTNTFTITAVGNPVSYSISYKDTTSDTSVTGAPISPATITSGQTNIGDSTISATLPTSIPTRTGYTFNKWCDGTVTHVASGNSTCSGTTYSAGASYTIDRTKNESNIELKAMWNVNQYTCTKRYRLQNADGTWGSYSSDGTEQVNYGSTCSYSKSVTDYKNSASGTNGATASTSGTMTTSGLTLSLNLYRNTYALTVNRNSTYISSASASTTAVHGSNYYRWGQSVSISATATSSGAFNGWTVSSGSTGSFASASSASTTYTMPKGASTIYADGKYSCLSSISGYMQDFDPSNLCSSVTSGSLTDRRDNQVYTAAKINGNWWMTRNLAIGCNGSGSTYGSGRTTRSLTSTYSNVSSSWSTSSARSLDKSDNTSGCTTSSTSDCNSYTTARMKCSSTYGAWYNYAAASAGTITGDSNTTDATYDVCPKGWRLPTNTEFSSITSYSSAFSPVTGGRYYSSSIYYPEYGFWWSATSYNSTERRSLHYDGSLGTYYSLRNFGYYVRCIRSS